MQSKKKLTIFEMALFAMYAALMVASKYAMEILPNIHLLGMFIVLFTYIYRVKALIPIYIFVGVTGLIAGFDMWWLPYTYVWAVLWAAAMLIPKNISKKAALIVFPIVCSLHGFLYGILYAPVQAIMFGYSIEQTVAWIVSGIPFDITHGISNFAMGLLIYPLSEVIKKAHKYIYR